MPAVFISYRRADSASAAGRIDDQLVARFGRASVFKDVDSIPPGVDFARYIEDAIQQSAVALVIIGPRWLTASAGPFQRRLDDPADFVRIEIETAARLGVPIIPLLVDGATMPPAARLPTSLRLLASLNALPVRPDPDFHRDMGRVIPAVERLMAAPPPTPPTLSEPAPTKAPALPDAPDTLPTRQRLDEPAFTGALPATRSVAAQRAEADSGARLTLAETGKRPAVTPAARMGVKPSRRPPGTLVATISVLALIGVVATLLFSSEGLGFLGAFAPSPTNTPNNATKTIQAAQAAISTYAVTQTAQALQLTRPYQPNGVGPCDTSDPTPSGADSSYWSWSQFSGNKVICSSSGIAEMFGRGTLKYYGVALGFPSAFTAKLTLSFHPVGDSASCAFLYLNTSDSNLVQYDVMLCSDGSWVTPMTGARHCCISANGVFKLIITVTSETIEIKANSQTVFPPKGYFRVVTLIGIQGEITAPGAWVGASEFILSPTPKTP